MKNYGKLRWDLSLEPGYQTIYWSLWWLNFFIGLIAWIEITVFNWITVVFWVIALLLLFIAKTHQLCIENEQLVFSCFYKEKRQVPVNGIAKITYSATRLVVLMNDKETKIKHFFLRPKMRKKFLAHISSCYPTIKIEKTMLPFDK